MQLVLPKMGGNLSAAAWQKKIPCNDSEGQMQNAREPKEPLFPVFLSIREFDSACLRKAWTPGGRREMNPSFSFWSTATSHPPACSPPSDFDLENEAKGESSEAFCRCINAMLMQTGI